MKISLDWLRDYVDFSLSPDELSAKLTSLGIEVEAVENLAKKFKARPDSRWELTLAQPIKELPRGKLTVAVKDRQGNVSRIERTFSVAPKK